ncbi:MAG: branched-chain amino acid ABC transporter permease [Pseudomonadota bacterium]
MTASSAGRPAVSVPTSLLVGLAILTTLALLPPLSTFYGGSYLLSLVTKAMVLGVVAISLDLLIGHGGMVSFGHAAFFAIGAYVTGIALEEGVYNALTILLMVTVACAAFALVTGAISLRTSGVYFIMITLAFGQMLFFTLTSLSAYGADDGLTLWNLAEFYGTGILSDKDAFFYVVLVTLAAVWLLVWRISRSRFGRVLRAAKENPARVAAMGFDVFRFRLIAYVIAGVLAGIGGFLLAHRTEFISPTLSSWQTSGDLIIIVILGGLGTRNGALIGALFFVLLEEFLSNITQNWRLLFAPILLCVVLFAKGGLTGLVTRWSGSRG